MRVDLKVGPYSFGEKIGKKSEKLPHNPHLSPAIFLQKAKRSI